MTGAWDGRARLLSSEFLITASRLAIRRWDRLTPAEQDRFRELSQRAGGDSRAHLDPGDRKELRALWSRLEVRELIWEVLGLAAGGEGKGKGKGRRR